MVEPNDKLSEKRDLHGTSECPICGWNEPHAHSAAEILERPAIDWARLSFEREARSFLSGVRFKGVRTGFYWAWDGNTGSARGTQDDIYHGWAARQSPTGNYLHEFTQLMWTFWRMAWVSSRSHGTTLPAPAEVSVPEVSRLSSDIDAAKQFLDKYKTFGWEQLSWQFAKIREGAGFDILRMKGAESACASLLAQQTELIEALKAVVHVADRKTVEFDAARAILASRAKGSEGK